MTSAPSPTTTEGVGFRSERGPVLGALMLTTGLVALDSTIIATAVPSIVQDVGGFTQFPWLFSIYLLTAAVSVPLYGKLADVIGRKPLLFFGIAVFLLGSILCGVAWSMPALIAFRAVQGIGAGAIQPISMTVVGDLYSVAERARVQGYLASVWGASSVIGPTLGGVFAQYLSWRWIFFVNIPLGAVAAWMLLRHFSEKVTRRSHRLDYTGAGLLTVGCSLVILGLLEGGVSWAWGSAQSLLIFGVGAVLLLGFWLVERRAPEPVLPLWVFTRRTLAAGNLTAVAVGALTIGLSSYVPTYVQGVLGTGALVAGFALAALTVGWPLAATFSGRIYTRIGFRDTALIGAAVALVGTLLCTPPRADGAGVAGGRRLLRGGGRPRLPVQPRGGGGAVGRRLGPPRRGDRHQHVLPLPRQRARCGGLRRRRQRDARLPPGPRPEGRGRVTAGRRDQPGDERAREPGARRRHRVRPRGPVRRLARRLRRPGGRRPAGGGGVDADAAAHRAAHLRLSLPAVRLAVTKKRMASPVRIFPTPAG